MIRMVRQFKDLHRAIAAKSVFICGCNGFALEQLREVNETA